MGLFEILAAAAVIAGDIACIVALLAMIIKPIRKRIFANDAEKDGQLCLLRSEIVRTYYRNLDKQELREYEYENMCLCYKAYRARGGNSFVQHIYEEMQDWKVVR